MRSRNIMILCLVFIGIPACIPTDQHATKINSRTVTETITITRENTLSPTNNSVNTETVPIPRKVKGLYDIGSHKIYIDCTGSGSPVVILEAGWNDVSGTWAAVQQDVAAFTRVCSYDRAGLGKSPAGPEPRTLDKEVADLYQLLEETGVDGPYVLVGHSYGGMLIRLFTDQHPEQVTGMVLVDSPHPDIYRRSLVVLPPESPDEGESVRFYREWFTQEIEKPTMKIAPALLAPGSLGDLPLIVLTAMLKDRPEDFPQELNDNFNQIWLDLQEELASMSTNSSHILAEKSGHFIQHDQPELVVEAIKGIVQELR